MSSPGPGVLLVTMGSKSGSKKSGVMRSTIAPRSSPSRTGNPAPSAAAARTAAPNASGVVSMTKRRAVRLLNGPVFIQKSLAYFSTAARVPSSTPPGWVTISSRTSRISRLCS